MAEYEKAPHTPTTDNTNAKFLLQSEIESQSRIAETHLQDEKVIEDSHGMDTPTRIFSLCWWKRRSNRIVPAGLWPRVLYCMIALVLLTIWFLSMLVLPGQEPIRTEIHEVVNRYRPEGLMTLRGSLISFDMEKRILTISWEGLYRLNDTVGNIGFADPDYPDSRVREGIEIYRDITSEPYNASYVDADNSTHWMWTYQIDNQTAKPAGVIGMHPWDSFDTDITFTQRYSKNPWVQPLLGYPFDQWDGGIVFVANNVTLSKFFNLNGTGVIEINGIELTDYALNWKFEYDYQNSCGRLDPNTLTPFCHIEVNFIGTRSGVVIICAMITLVVNWTCASFIFILTCETVFMGRSYILQGTDILSMCFTALFALPAIRILLPGAPAYGAIIDLVGVLPCALTIAICTVCISIVKLKARHKVQKEE
ncbi:hypothetical protein FRC19_011125 [Serendipita sp. 401]|nr:hypothetical protein FRC19_011125 [Serendipita sp. 401]KAG8819955.1 hypothetical protein FRC18_011879 [Serendipita sp. 400]KAG9037370.1 hypothetical protein FS842_003354 [Serendipita sp. 407]